MGGLEPKNRFLCWIGGGLLDTYIVIQPMGDSLLTSVPNLDISTETYDSISRAFVNGP